MQIDQLFRTKNRKTLKKLLDDDLNLSWAFSSACTRKYAKTARWIAKHYKIPSSLVLQWAVDAGQLKLAKWIHSREPVRFPSRAFWSQYIVPQNCSNWLWRNFQNSGKDYLFNKVSDDWAHKRELQLVCFFTSI
jgi:hypothetical protein